MSDCPSCGATDLQAGSRFCFSCGAGLGAPTCVACGTELAVGSRFCNVCGANQEAPTPAAAAPPPAPVAGRRVTSVLFGDLVGFTTLSESRDQEEVRELLSRYFEECSRIVGRYGGTVEKFIGDAVMAVWGVPTAHEDDAERAVRAGLELVNATAALGEEQRVSGLAMRVGIVTGEVAVTIGATQQGMVAGDAVNTASRVQSAASPGQVWVDETTRLLTASAITYVDVGSHVLKGKAEPMPLWAVRAVVAAMGGAQRADGLEAPLVGRDRELRVVKELFHGSIDGHTPALTVVDGEPGVGKSRLAWEFEKYVDGLTSTTYWHSGRCVAYGEGVAFLALAEAFRVRLHVLAKTDADAREGPEDPERLVAGGLAALGLSSDEEEWLRPRMGALLGVGSVGSYPREDLFSAWTTFLERVSGGPKDAVVLLIDDAQHADEGLLQFVEHLLAAGSFPCFVVLLTRPGLLEGHPSLATNRRGTVVHVPLLSDADVATLLSGLVVGLPDSARDALIARSEGVPLFAVETVRSLIDRDLVVPRGGQYVVADPSSLDVESLAAPASLQALVAARLDSLAEEQRQVIDRASVLGMTFTPDALGKLCDGIADIDGVLASLLRSQLLSQESSRLSAEFGQYRFVQSVVRQVAYSMLSRHDRKRLHLRVVQVFDELTDTADELAAIIAQHYLDAIDAVPSDPDVDELGLAAIRQLNRAAVRARALGAPAEAILHLRAALELTKDPADRARAKVDIAEALLFVGRFQEAAEAAEEATATFDELGDVAAAGRAAAAHAGAVHRLGDREAASAIASPRWEALADHPGAVAEKFALVTVLRTIRSALGTGSSRLAETALALALQGGDEEQICSSLASLASGYLDTLPLVGKVLCEAAAARAREQHQPLALARALAALAAANLEDDLDAASSAAAEGAQVGAEIGDANWSGFSEVNLLIALFAQGDWLRIERELMGSDRRHDAALSPTWDAIEGSIALSKGEEWASPVPEEVTESFDLNSHAWQLYGEALTHVVRREPDVAAQRAVHSMEQLFEFSGISDDFPILWQWAVEIALAADAEAGLRRLLELARFEDEADQRISLGLRSHLERTRGLLAVRSDDAEAAEAAFRRAITGYERWHAPLYRFRTEADLGLLLCRQGRLDEGLPLVGGARAFYGAMGATAWMAELDVQAAVAP